MNANNLSVSLTVQDVGKSLTWYRDVLGFAVNQQYDRGGKLQAVSLSAGNARVLISQDDGSKGVDRAKGDGFSMMLTTDENIDEIAAGIKARGGTLDLEPADMMGRRACRLRDPDGFRFTISSEQRP